MRRLRQIKPKKRFEDNNVDRLISEFPRIGADAAFPFVSIDSGRQYPCCAGDSAGIFHFVYGDYEKQLKKGDNSTSREGADLQQMKCYDGNK